MCCNVYIGFIIIQHHYSHYFLLTACVYGQSLNWLVIGDWGGLPDFPYRTAIEKAISVKMASVARNISASFVLALGDNFYFDGVKSAEDPRFQVINRLCNFRILLGPT